MQLLQKSNKLSSLYIATFLFCVTFITYANTLGNGLFYDDEDSIYSNIYVAHFQFVNFFTQNLIAGAGKISNYYRPLLLLGFSLEYLLFGANGFIYHLDNLLLHAADSILLFILLNKLLKNKFISFLTALLFAIHPIQTEAVSYAAGRGDPQSVFFMLLSILLFFKKTKRSYIFSLFLFIFALLSKETAIVLPAIIIVAYWYQNNSLNRVWKQKLTFVPYILIAAVYFILRLTVLNFQNTLNFYNSATPYSTNILYRLFSFFSILPTYFQLLFFPKTLFIDRIAPVVTSPLHLSVLLSITFTLITFSFSLLVLKKQPIFLFCFLWFFICIAPVSGIIPINGILYEHFLYFPSVGVFLFIAYGIWQIATKIKSRFLFYLLFVVLCSTFLALGFRTIVRNQDWHDPITFYKQTIQNSPQSAPLYNNLAMAYADQNRTQDAIKNYKKTIALSDIYPQTHFNLGNSYIAIGDINSAEKEYEKTLEMDPGFARAYITLAQIYKQKNEEKKFNNLLNKLQILSQKNPSFTPLLQQIRTL